MKKEEKAPPLQSCGDCKFWLAADQTCHAHPPSMTKHAGTGGSAFPMTAADDWCGDYQNGNYNEARER
jgi:hypothetical protein